MGSSALYVGHVVHQRTRPKKHRLRYSIFSLLLDLDNVEALDRRLRLFSRNRINLFSFHDRDHAGGTGEPLRTQVEQHMRAAGITPDGGAIHLLTMPRILGFVFNPLSIYFCHRRDGTLAVILYEVNNTFGERHSYLLPVPPGTGSIVEQRCAKNFHVSPFLGMAMDYDFRVVPPGERLSVTVTVSDEEGPVLMAVQSAVRRPLDDGTLAWTFVTHPLLTLKVVIGILWEALKLWIKGVRVHPHPTPPEQSITLVSASSEAACT